ncbi:hypothetical protein [Vibrio splendidus]|uniref:hypothetical protein n=1 Tax=Vibrio splendidus TaxID=29497 RepID=UPI000D3B245A|nr:hypothetical protein [Vibrio splendidus]PTP42747.1 hypothetical protein CWN87_13020 [Vibrio splendidus]
MNRDAFFVIPMPEECVFSYIIRINMVLAPCRIPNIFAKNGRWSKYVTLPQRYQEIFSQNNDFQVFNLLLKSGVIEHQKDILKSPVDYTRTMTTFLKGGRVKKRSSNQIKYCPKCIAEFIGTYGFSYFKADWALWKSGDNCQIHREPFNIIDSGNKADALQAVEMVMMGKRSRFCKSLRDSPYYQEISDENYYSGNTEDKLPHLASCLENKLKAWLLSNNHTFPKNMITAVRCADHGSLVSSMESHVFRDFVFRKAYSSLHNSNYLRFHEFWKRYSELHMFYCGVIEKQGLKGKIAKLRGFNCSKCRDVFCPANLTIIQTRRAYWSIIHGYKCPGERML